MGLLVSVRSTQVSGLRETPQNPIHDKPPVRLQLYGQKGPAVCLSHKRIFILLSNPSCSHELQDA